MFNIINGMIVFDKETTASFKNRLASDNAEVRIARQNLLNEIKKSNYYFDADDGTHVIIVDDISYNNVLHTAVISYSVNSASSMEYVNSNEHKVNYVKDTNKDSLNKKINIHDDTVIAAA